MKKFPHTIEDLELSCNVTKHMQWCGITTVEQLCCTSFGHLISLTGFGKLSNREIARKLHRLGLEVGCGKEKWQQVKNAAVQTERDELCGIVAVLRAEVKAWRAIDRSGNLLLTDLEEMQAIKSCMTVTNAAKALEES